MSGLYVHYGQPAFDRRLFNPVRNIGGVKPYGGLWASPAASPLGWSDWCIENDFRTDSLKTGFMFCLADDARVLDIYRSDQLDGLPELDAGRTGWCFLDFEKLAQEYDAVELDLSNEVRDRWDSGLYYRLYGWDCDSILIMNPDIITDCETL